MKIQKKQWSLIFSLVLFFPGIIAQAQSLPFWLSLEQGKMHFRNGAYGDALLAFEDARRSRWDEISRMENDFILALSTPEVRRLGDSLEWVETYCSEQRLDSASRALRELYYRYPKAELDDSVTRAVEALGGLKAYPEAEFWLGETFRAEGELNLALRQYQKAYEERQNLESQEFEAEILYRIVEIHQIRQEYQEMENRALEILNGSAGNPRDKLWAGENFARTAMARILENNGVNRFLTLYRYNNSQVERVHRLLGSFYYATSRHNQAAEHLMFSFLIQSTLVIEALFREDSDFTFTTLDSLINAVQRRPDLLAYLEETLYFRGLYYLGYALYATGKFLPARQIWTFLSGREDVGEWQIRARNQLQSPYTERAVESP